MPVNPPGNTFRHMSGRRAVVIVFRDDATEPPYPTHWHAQIASIPEAADPATSLPPRAGLPMRTDGSDLHTSKLQTLLGILEAAGYEGYPLYFVELNGSGRRLHIGAIGEMPPLVDNQPPAHMQMF